MKNVTKSAMTTAKPLVRSSRNCDLCVETWPIIQIKPNPHNTRTHSAKQIRQIANSMGAFGFSNPLLLSEDGELIAGHGRLRAAKLLRLEEVPVIVLEGLSPAKRRALAIADNKIAENGGWNRERLTIALPELTDALIAEELDVSILGFTTIEMEHLQSRRKQRPSNSEDRFQAHWFNGPTVSRLGDVWLFDSHKLMCGDASSAEGVARLMANCPAHLAFLDPVPPGDRSRLPDFTGYLRRAFNAAAAVSVHGAVHFVRMSPRYIAEVMAEATTIYGEPTDVAVWVDASSGEGVLYSDQPEIVGVFHVGHSAAAKTLRRRTRRSSVWHYPSVEPLVEMDDFRSHRKPVTLFADAIKDGSRKGDVIFDNSAGWGTVIMAAERVGRHARAVELDPRLVDVSVRRWRAVTGNDAIHAETGLSFDATAAARAQPEYGSVTTAGWGKQ